MSRPKVILIGGCPGAGKTTLGRALAARLGYASLTIDDLVNAARAITTPQSHPGLHVMNRPNFTEYFTNSPVRQLIDDATRQHQAIWPAVERTIRNHATWGCPIVIDGFHLRPEWTRSLNVESVSAHWLVIDPTVLEDRERRNVEFVSQSAHPRQMLDRFLARSRWCNELVATQARSCGDPILQQDGTKSVEDLCRQVESRFADQAS